MISKGLSFNHADIGVRKWAMVTDSERLVWDMDVYQRRFPGYLATLSVPWAGGRGVSLLSLETTLETMCRRAQGVPHWRRLLRGDDCLGIAATALRLWGYPVHRLCPRHLLETLYSVKGVTIDHQATR